MTETSEVNMLAIPQEEYDELKNKGVSNPYRRRALKVLLGVTPPIVLAVACSNPRLATGEPSTPDSDPPVDPPPQPINESAEVAPDPYTFDRIEFQNRSGTPDYLMVMGKNKPLTKAELSDYMLTRKQVDIPPARIRTSEIFVEQSALASWNNQVTQGTEHESFESFIKHHFVDLPNQALMNTRPEAGINDMRMDSEEFPTKVIIVEDEATPDASLFNQESTGITSEICSDNVYAQYHITAEYANSLQHTGDHINDFGIPHEISHQSLYLIHHHANYFLDLENWRDYAQLPQSESITNNDISLWNLPAMKDQLSTFSLQNGLKPSGSSFGYPEELTIRRVTQSKNHPVNNLMAQGMFSDTYDMGEISHEYNFQVESSTTAARLYTATLDQSEPGGNDHWNFTTQAPQELTIADNNILISHELLSGEIARTNPTGEPQKLPKAFLLVTEKDGQKQCMGFTSLHLMHWHYSEQVRNNEQQLGKEATTYPVTVKTSEFSSM